MERIPAPPRCLPQRWALLAEKVEGQDLHETRATHLAFPCPSLLHRTAFLSDPADGSLYILGTQKQQGLMVCFPSLPGMGVGRTVCQSGMPFEAVRQGSGHYERLSAKGGGGTGCVCRAEYQTSECMEGGVHLQDSEGIKVKTVLVSFC